MKFSTHSASAQPKIMPMQTSPQVKIPLAPTTKIHKRGLSSISVAT